MSHPPFEFAPSIPMLGDIPPATSSLGGQASRFCCWNCSWKVGVRPVGSRSSHLLVAAIASQVESETSPSRGARSCVCRQVLVRAAGGTISPEEAVM